MIPASGTVIQTPSRPPNHMRRSFVVTGILHTILGGLEVIFGIVAICIMAWYSYFAIPIWGGIWFGVTGLMGMIAGAKQHSVGMKVTYLVVSVISACQAGSMAFVHGFGAGYDSAFSWENGCRPGTYFTSYCGGNSGARIGINVTLCVLSVFEMVLAIFSASAVCFFYCRRGPTGTPVYFQTGLPAGQFNQGGMMVQTPNNQFVMVSPQQLPMQTLQVPQGHVVLHPQFIQGNPVAGQQHPPNPIAASGQVVHLPPATQPGQGTAPVQPRQVVNVAPAPPENQSQGGQAPQTPPPSYLMNFTDNQEEK